MPGTDWLGGTVGGRPLPACLRADHRAASPGIDLSGQSGARIRSMTGPGKEMMSVVTS